MPKTLICKLKKTKIMTSQLTYWHCIQKDLQLKFSLSQYQAWLGQIQFVKLSNIGKVITLQVPTKFHKDRIEKKFKTELLNSINKYYTKATTIHFELAPKVMTEDILIDSIYENIDLKSKSPTPFQAKSNQPTRSYTTSKTKPNPNELGIFESAESIQSRPSFSVLPKQNIHNLNSKFTFDTLVGAEYNELAISVAKAIIKQPGSLYNPIFLHSPTGLGKTHLLQAIGHKFMEVYPSYNIRYTTSEAFLNHYTECMRTGKGNEFHQYYRSIDLLLIDDIQTLTNKTSTQEVLFHTFNELHQQNKQIIVTSDRNPKSLNGFQDRLISRFEWGMVLDLPTPSLEDKIAIIKSKVINLKLSLDNQQITQIAQSIQTNIRDIEGVLNQIQARQNFNDTFSISTLESILKPYYGVMHQGLMQLTYNQPPQKNPTNPSKPINFVHSTSTLSDSQGNSIIQLVAKQMQIDIADIFSKKRTQKINQVRQITIYLLFTRYSFSCRRICQLLQKKSHSTILHSVNKVTTELKSNPEIINWINQISLA
jgi:chromosomal replication initiator protein